VVLAYKWRSVVYNIGKDHGQNRGPTIARNIEAFFGPFRSNCIVLGLILVNPE
jgi:hypothetical protein